MGNDFLTAQREDRVGRDAVNEVVCSALKLDAPRRRVGMDTQRFVQLLAVAAAFDALHHDVLGRHEGELFHHTARHDAVIDNEPLRNVDIDVQNGVYGQKSLGYRDALIRAVVKRALEPLGTGRHGRVEAVGDHIARQRREALAAHGVSLVGHGARADLVRLERLLHLLE